MSIREGLQTDNPVSLMLLDVMAEALSNGVTRPLCLPIFLRVLSSSKVVLRPQHGADSDRAFRDEPPSAIGEHYLQGAVRKHPLAEDCAGDSRGRGSPEG